MLHFFPYYVSLLKNGEFLQQQYTLYTGVLHRFRLLFPNESCNFVLKTII